MTLVKPDETGNVSIRVANIMDNAATLQSNTTLVKFLLCQGSWHDTKKTQCFLCDPDSVFNDMTKKAIHYLTSVSYTHLDVYKRQILYRYSWSCLGRW